MGRVAAVPRSPARSTRTSPIRSTLQQSRRHEKHSRTRIANGMGLAALRQALGLTPVEVAKRLEVTQGNVAQIEKRGDLLGYFGVRDSGGAIRTFFRPTGGPEQWLDYFYGQFAPSPA